MHMVIITSKTKHVYETPSKLHWATISPNYYTVTYLGNINVFAWEQQGK